MDDQAVIRTYGNTNLPEGTEERPLVTFALFAYNQEKYIREAVEGAFSQTYSPLEIILSDDCSSDRTFQIMEEMAREYRGPHRIILFRQGHNYGVVRHVLNVARIANGNLFIVAAGDDLSYPERSQRICDRWLETGASCINSRYDEINEAGSVVRTGITFIASQDAQRILGYANSARRRNGLILSAVGFCAAYETGFWKALPNPTEKLMVEDGLATCILNLKGNAIEFVDASLIAYRVHSSSLSLRDASVRFEDLLRREEKIAVGAREVIGRTTYLRNLLRPDMDRNMLESFRGVEMEADFSQRILDFIDGNFATRFGSLIRTRSLRELRFYLPRLFGARFLWYLRRVLR